MSRLAVVHGGFQARLAAVTLASTLFLTAEAGPATASAYTAVITPATAPGSLATGREIDLSGNSSDAARGESGQPQDPAAAGADMWIDVSASPALVRSGDQISYTITVRNNGPLSATDVSVTESLPPGVSPITATPSQGACLARTPVACELGSLADGAEATIVVEAEVEEIESCGPIAGRFEVTAKEPDPDSISRRSRNEAEVMIAVEGIAVATESTTYFISGDRSPRMPEVIATAQLCGPASILPTKFTWNYEVHYNPSKHAKTGPDRDLSYAGWGTKESGGPGFTLDFSEVIRGGELNISASSEADGRLFHGATRVTILGENPSMKAAKEELDLAWAEALSQDGGRVARTLRPENNYTLWRIAQQESVIRQFVSEADLPWYTGEPGWPKWNMRGDGGVGIMQVTPPESDDEVWDWTRNVRGGVRQLLQKVRTSAQLHDPAYPWSVVRQPGWKELVEGFVADFNRSRQEECREAGVSIGCSDELKPEDVKLEPLSRGDWNCDLGQRELNAIRLYNGAHGKDPNLLPELSWLYEYTVELEDGLWDGPLVVELEPEGGALQATAKWRRIPGEERTELLLEQYRRTSAWQLPGDPNYVEKVLDKSEAVDVCRPDPDGLP